MSDKRPCIFWLQCSEQTDIDVDQLDSSRIMNEVSDVLKKYGYKVKRLYARIIWPRRYDEMVTGKRERMGQSFMSEGSIR